MEVFSSSTGLLLGLLFFVIYLIYKDSSKKGPKDAKKIPGPKQWPLIGSILYMAKFENPVGAFYELGKEFGEIVGLKLGNYNAVVVSGLDLIRQVLITRAHLFDSRPDFKRFHMLFENERNNSMAFSDWTDDLHQKRTMVSHHTFPKSTSKFYSNFNRIASTQISLLQSELISNFTASNTPFHIKPHLSNHIFKLFMSYFCSITINDKNRKSADACIRAFDDVFQEINAQCIGDLFPSLMPMLGKSHLPALSHTIRKFTMDHVVKPRLAILRKKEMGQWGSSPELRSQSEPFFETTTQSESFFRNEQNQSESGYFNNNNRSESDFEFESSDLKIATQSGASFRFEINEAEDSQSESFVQKNFNQSASSGHKNSNQSERFLNLPPVLPSRNSVANMEELIDGNNNENLGIINGFMTGLRPKEPEIENLMDEFLLNIEKNEGMSLEQSLFAIEDIFGGHSAVANFLTTTFVHLAQNPEVQDKVLEEVENVCGNEGINLEHKLPWTESVVWESSRHLSSALVPHAANQTTQLGEYTVEKGTILFLNNYDLNFSEELWDEPLKFNPARFVKNNNVLKPDHFIPFGLGRRSCLGFRILISTSTLIVASLCSKFTFHLDENEKYPKRLGSLAVPGLGYKLKISPRN